MERMIPRRITLRPHDWELARKIAEEAGQRGFSAGLRAIIQFYRQHHEQAQPAPQK